MKPSFLFIPLFSLLSIIGKAQSLSFQINSIGSNPNMTTGSLSFQIESIANCFFVANGLAIYKPPIVKAITDKACELPIQYDHYGLKIYPQPIGNRPRIQLTRQIIHNCPFSIRWYTMEGKMVLQETINGFALSTGSIMNTSTLFAGAYIVQVISDNSIDIIQVIKQD
jgi:hypothetical protein